MPMTPPARAAFEAARGAARSGGLLAIGGAAIILGEPRRRTRKA